MCSNFYMSHWKFKLSNGYFGTHLTINTSRILDVDFLTLELLFLQEIEVENRTHFAIINPRTAAPTIAVSISGPLRGFKEIQNSE